MAYRYLECAKREGAEVWGIEVPQWGPMGLGRGTNPGKESGDELRLIG